MTIERIDGEFSVCKLSGACAVDPNADFVFYAKTDREISLVCPVAAVPEGAVREDGWRGMRVSGRLDFSLVGVLSGITGTLAACGICVFAVSTYDTDYIFTRACDYEAALDALGAAGYRTV